MKRHPVRNLFIRIGFAFVLAATTAFTVDAYSQNIERGRALYENHCQVCHDVQIHGRKGRVSFGVAELRAIVERWQANQKLRWSAEEIEDVVQFLSTTRYFFTTSIE